MTLPFEVFALGYSMTIVTATIAALLYFVGPGNIKASIIVLNFRKYWLYIVALILLPIIIFLESRFTPLFDSENLALKNASWMYSHGGEVIRYIQNRLEVGLITDIFIFIYVWLFAFIIYFTPIYLLVKNDTALFRKFAIAIFLNYIILLPFYTFFPVVVTSFSPPTMLKPLLYIDTTWGMLVTSMDPLDNGFPSGHISLLLTTLLVVSSNYHHRRYTHFVMWGLIAITVAILYLGIHWIMDILGGIALAVGIVLLVGNTHLLDARLPLPHLISAEAVGQDSFEGEGIEKIEQAVDTKDSSGRLGRIFRKTR